MSNEERGSGVVELINCQTTRDAMNGLGFFAEIEALLSSSWLRERTFGSTRSFRPFWLWKHRLHASGVTVHN